MLKNKQQLCKFYKKTSILMFCLIIPSSYVQGTTTRPGVGAIIGTGVGVASGALGGFTLSSAGVYGFLAGKHLIKAYAQAKAKEDACPSKTKKETLNLYLLLIKTALFDAAKNMFAKHFFLTKTLPIVAGTTIVTTIAGGITGGLSGYYVVKGISNIESYKNYTEKVYESDYNEICSWYIDFQTNEITDEEKNQSNSTFKQFDEMVDQYSQFKFYVNNSLEKLDGSKYYSIVMPKLIKCGQKIVALHNEQQKTKTQYSKDSFMKQGCESLRLCVDEITTELKRDDVDVNAILDAQTPSVATTKEELFGDGNIDNEKNDNN